MAEEFDFSELVDSCKDLESAVDELGGVSDQLSINSTRKKFEKVQELSNDVASSASSAESSADEAEKLAEEALGDLDDLESDINRAQEGIKEVTRIASAILTMVKPFLPIPPFEKAIAFCKAHKNEIKGVWKDNPCFNERDDIVAAFYKVAQTHGEVVPLFPDADLQDLVDFIRAE